MERRNQKKGQKQKKDHSIIEEKPNEEDKDDGDEEEEEEDDQLNEQLFSMYDEMFKHFNDFGAMFQNSAQLIGQLIRKNMILNQQNEQLENILPQKIEEIKNMEGAYEELLKEIQNKDRLIEDLQGENTGLKLQLEQFLQIKQPVPQPQRDILKEREQAAAQEKRNSKSGRSTSRNPLLQNEYGKPTSSTSNANLKPTNSAQIQGQMQPPNNKRGIPASGSSGSSKNQDIIAGTYESFFDLEKIQNPIPENDSCSLKDLFSHRNTKKRHMHEISSGAASGQQEDQNEQWLGGKGIKKKKRRSYYEESQLADKFDQLSQAFFQASNKGGISVPSSGTDNQNSLKFPRNSIGSEIGILGANNEDSVSDTSIINACIKFDSKQARDSIVQSKLNFNKKQQANVEKKNGDQKYQIKMIDQVTESQVDDFFQIKKEKKSENQKQKSLATTTRSNSGAHNKKIPKKML